MDTTGPEGDAEITAPQPVVPRHAHEAPPAHHHVAGPQAVHEPAHAAHRRLGRGAVAGAVVAALVLAGGVTAAALTRTDNYASPVAAGTPTPGAGDTDPVPAPPDATESAEPVLDPAAPTLVLGDSLGLTVYPWLAELLPDRYVSYEAEVGRSTTGSESALEDLGDVPPLVIVSSGTNDATVEDVESSARDILDELGPDRCVVWVDVVRPDGIAAPDEDINAAIDRAVAGRDNVRVLAWSTMIEEHPEWMSADGIHPNRDGALARAQAFADAALACSELDPDAPLADRQYLPASAFVGAISGTATLAPQNPVGTSTPSTGGGDGQGEEPSESAPTSQEPTGSGSPSPALTGSASPTPSASRSSSPPAPAPSTSSAAPPPPPTSSSPPSPAATSSG